MWLTNALSNPKNDKFLQNCVSMLVFFFVCKSYISSDYANVKSFVYVDLSIYIFRSTKDSQKLLINKFASCHSFAALVPNWFLNKCIYSHCWILADGMVLVLLFYINIVRV